MPLCSYPPVHIAAYGGIYIKKASRCPLQICLHTGDEILFLEVYAYGFYRNLFIGATPLSFKVAEANREAADNFNLSVTQTYALRLVAKTF